MALPVLGVVNHVDRSGTVLTASDTAGDLGPSNMVNPIIARPWRTTSLTAYCTIDFGADVDIGVLALRFPRNTAFPTAGTVQHQLDPNGGSAGAGATYDSGAVSINTTDGYGYHVIVLGSEYSARYWHFTFNVSGVSFVDVGRAWAGPVFRSTYGLAYGDQDTWADPSLRQQGARSGAVYVDRLEPWRVMSDSFVALSNSERSDVREIARQAGVANQVIFIRDPNTVSTETVIGRFRSVPVWSQQQWGRSVSSFVIEESL
ncbi:hypothetical protein [Pyruvatibacter mobilis]|uniref:hypothetical protein n=1 Tax=Pyruvatibacter mobilis TaxID=1712261 RepID=UPI003BB079A2